MVGRRPPPQVARGDVARDLPEPGLEGPGGVVAVELAVEADEYLLGQVLCLVAVLQVLVGQAKDAALEAVHHLFERGQVSVLGESGQSLGACRDVADALPSAHRQSQRHVVQYTPGISLVADAQKVINFA